mgnify:CR=1 FL=1
MQMMSVSSTNYNPVYFKANPVKKVRYAVEYIDCAVQRNCPLPAIYRQLLPFQPEKAPMETLTVESSNPVRDLKEIYDLYKNDFSCYHNYLSYKKFKNNLSLDNASVFLLKSNNETVGFYSVNKIDNDTLYIYDIDLVSKYRNTRKGKDVILTCWENINKLAKSNGCAKIGLHVDASKNNLVSMYEKFGFHVVEGKSAKYPTGKPAYYMEKEAGVW